MWQLGQAVASQPRRPTITVDMMTVTFTVGDKQFPVPRAQNTKNTFLLELGAGSAQPASVDQAMVQPYTGLLLHFGGLQQPLIIARHGSHATVRPCWATQLPTNTTSPSGNIIRKPSIFSGLESPCGSRWTLLTPRSCGATHSAGSASYPKRGALLPQSLRSVSNREPHGGTELGLGWSTA